MTFGSLSRFVALDLRHDPALTFVLVFSLAAFAGLATSLFAPRRRLWIRAAAADADEASSGQGSTVVSAAGLARGDDVGLQPELERVVVAALAAAEGQAHAQTRTPVRTSERGRSQDVTDGEKA